ncbi:hypothetical protein HNO89_000076 [Sporosarcina luteola]|nr:hypothetical protein [Sporosarcina luteola]
MKELVFWILIGIVEIGWIANYLYADSKRLAEPIFLDHYVEITNDFHDYIFYYLTNQGDQSKVNYVRMIGIDGYMDREFSPSTWGFNRCPVISLLCIA